MAAHMEGMTFCQIANENDIYVSDGYNDDTVILSRNRKSVDVYKLSDQKCIKSWSIRHDLTVTSPALWDTQTETLVTVTNNQDVRMIDKELQDFEKAKKKHANSQIYNVMLASGFDPVILYRNGVVDFLANIKDDHQNGFLQDFDAICWCKAFVLQTKLHVLFVQQKQPGAILHVNWYDDGNTVWHHTTCDVKLADKSVLLCSCDCSYTQDTCTVYFLWTFGDLSSCCVVSGGIVRPSGVSHSVPGVKKNACMVTLDSTHIAIAGVEHEQQDGICIFDTKFGIQQLWQPFPVIPTNRGKIFLAKGHLFMSCGTTLYMYNVHCEPSSVRGLLGQGTNSNNKQPVPGHYVWEQKKKIRTEMNMAQDPSAVRDMFTNALGSSLSAGNFKKIAHQLIVELKKTENQHWLMSCHVITLLHRVMEEPKYWIPDIFRELISMNCIPLSMMCDVLDCLIQKSEISLIHYLLCTAKSVPEKCLCKAIEFFLECDDETLAVIGDSTDKEPMVAENVLGVNTSKIINEMLSLPFNDIFLLECLRNIAFKNALKLLKHFSFLLETTPYLPESQVSGPSLKQITGWLGLLIDAHFVHFVLAPDCHVEHIQLNSIIRQAKEHLERCVRFKAIAEQYLAKSVHTKEKKVGKYCIEVIHV